MVSGGSSDKGSVGFSIPVIPQSRALELKLRTENSALCKTSVGDSGRGKYVGYFISLVFLLCTDAYTLGYEYKNKG